ncbi:brachyurin-like [Agrilus planipennis]|uniref:Brachyurin-like n=1 Tax=Agrilus planipennis TaxID=224129 RepID=A0A1W4XBH0_AGRPL|nr:brachyurin-like [Agrilus planipennis]
MKQISLIFIASSLVTAHVTTDWSKVLPTRETAYRGLSQLESSKDVKIVGGNEAAPNSIPYQAGMFLYFNEGWNFCGGSLITRRYVLTAAHCLVNKPVSVEVILGAHKIRQTEPTQQRIRTSTYKVHEQYNSLQNDIGIVSLPTPANLNQYVQLIALPRRADISNSFAGSEAIASGWGYTSTSAADISDVLRYINVPIITNDVCNATIPGITGSMVCSGGAGNKGVCYGDSGGPLMASRKLVGIAISIGLNGCEAGDPSIFTRVTSHLDWISANSDAVIS